MAQSWSGNLGTIRWPGDATVEVAALPSDTDLQRMRRWLIISGVLGLIGGIAAIAVPAISSAFRRSAIASSTCAGPPRVLAPHSTLVSIP